MVNPIQLPLLLTQLPQLQKIQNALQSHPDSYQDQVAKEVAEEQKKAKVPKAEEAEGMLRVGPDEKREREGFQNKKRRKKKEQEEERETSETAASGQIIDLKV